MSLPDLVVTLIIPLSTFPYSALKPPVNTANSSRVEVLTTAEDVPFNGFVVNTPSTIMAVSFTLPPRILML